MALMSPLDAPLLDSMVDPVPPERIMQLQRLVSSSVADIRCRLLENIEELTRQLGESLESQFIQLLSQEEGETLAPCTRLVADSESLQTRQISAVSSSAEPQVPSEQHVETLGSHTRFAATKDYGFARQMSPGIGIASLCIPQLPVLQEDCPESRVAPLSPVFTDPEVEAANTSPVRGSALSPEAARRSVSLLGRESQVTSAINYQTGMQQIVNTKAFESLFSIVILLNCASMGLEVHEDINEEFSDWVIEALNLAEHIFTILFCIELLMRATANGCRSFLPSKNENWWNFLDALLVIFTGIIFTWIIPMLSIIIGFSGDSGVIRIFTVLRAVRLVRLVRVFQRVPVFREAWLLIRGLTDSVRTLFWTCVVIAFVTYVFAIFGLVLVVKDLKDKYSEALAGSIAHTELQELMLLLGGMDKLMYTLIQVLTMDSFHAIMRMTLQYVWWSWIYFYAYIGVAVFVLMNLVTAIIVDNAVTKSRNDVDHELRMKENSKSRDLKELQNLFEMMDADGSGTLSWEEFKESFGNAELTRKWKMLDFGPEECREIFTLLDTGQGEIETQEFFEGLSRMKGSAASKDIFRLQKTLENFRAEVKFNMSIDSPNSKYSLVSKAASNPPPPKATAA